ncbi:MAG: S-methyl-5'-thioadenosine phosphorylase [Pseudomonadota bacterium]
MTKAVLGVIGGSGLYDMPGLENRETRSFETAWGTPSAPLVFGTLNGTDMVFMPRHSGGHTIPPSDINYRANIDAMKQAGVTDLLSVSACGSFKDELSPGTFVIIDQFIDRTFARVKSFFGAGCVAHVSMAHPISPLLADRAEAAAKAEGIPVSKGGTYLAMEGPQFSSLAESLLYKQWGCGVIGMTNMPEAKLAREAELCYATVAMVTDYDSWHEGHGEVDIQAIIQVMHANVAKARALLEAVIPRLTERPEACPEGCDRALEYAIITDPSARDPALVAKLDAVAGRVLGKAA